MRLLLLFQILIVLSSCHRSKNLGTKPGLSGSFMNADTIVPQPDNNLINEVIFSVIKIDSFSLRVNLNSQIQKFTVYKPTYVDNDSSLQIPSPPNSVSYDALFNFFNSSKNLMSRYEDSVFVNQQVNLFKACSISDSILSCFNKNESISYDFYLPVFSHEKSIVYVYYTMSCGDMCGNFYAMVLKRDHNRWVKMFKYFMGGH